MNESKFAAIPVGAVFGKWTVMGDVVISRNTPKTNKRSYILYYYQCRCRCGTTKNVNGVNLIDGASTQCTACSNREKGEALRLDLNIGAQYGNYTVIERCDTPPNSRGTHYVVSCGCGEIRKLSASIIKFGRKSKTCKQCANNKQKGRLKYEGTSPEPTIKNLIGVYIHSAKSRNLEYQLEYDYFVDITSQCCHYCGVEPLQIHKYSAYPNYKYNGIDRIDCGIGYVNGNCVPCCIVCNRGRMDMTMTEWDTHIKRLTKHQSLRKQKPLGNASLQLCIEI